MAQETSQSWLLDYLPAIFHQDDGADGRQGSFLGQFLKPFDSVLSGFEELLAVIDSYFSPDTSPADWVPWLAEWIALDLDETWKIEKGRELVRKAMELHRRRGTVAGLKQTIEIYNPQLVVTLCEGRRRGGMQIEVASRIGGLTPVDQASPLDQHAVDASVSVKHRGASGNTFGVFIFDTTATADHPFLGTLVASNTVKAGEAIQLVLRTDQVKRLQVDGKDGDFSVEVSLIDPFMVKGVTRKDALETNLYPIATGTRRNVEFVGDALILEVYPDQVEEVELAKSDEAGHYKVSIRLKDKLIQFNATKVARIDGFTDDVFRFTTETNLAVDFTGDTFLIDEVEAPYAFTIAIEVPEKHWPTVTQPQGLRAISRIIEETKPAHTTYSLTLSGEVDKPRLQTMQIGVQSLIGDGTCAIG